jgi:hypothetical protein
MPKEVIYSSLLPYDEETPAVGIAELGWSRESEYVQIATRCVHRADHSVWHRDEQEWRRAVDLSMQFVQANQEPNASTLDAVFSAEEQRFLFDFLLEQFGAGLTVADGFFVQLDRRGINDLIRHLRRARDAAFGRDE